MSLFSPLYALFLSVLVTTQTWGAPNTVHNLKVAFSKHLLSRDQYLDQLATLRFEIMMIQEKITPDEEAEILAIDDEVRKNPIIPNDSGKILSRLRVGVWESPRHDYLYRADGSWTMLPIIPHVTQGRWRIERNLYYDWIPSYSLKEIPYKIILLDKSYFIFTDGEHIEYDRRLK